MTAEKRKKLLLHSCCGPCSTAVLERLCGEFDISVFYYNPNITDGDEYALRRGEQQRFLSEWAEAAGGASAAFIPGRYDPTEYYNRTAGLEQEPEGGARCEACFRLRLEETAKAAAEGGFDAFDTTLSVSPHKSYALIDRAGKDAAEQFGVEYLAGNYRKKDGYGRSAELAREYGLYRQDYCGCEFSKREAQERRRAKGSALSSDKGEKSCGHPLRKEVRP